jgi:hypothetical protein
LRVVLQYSFDEAREAYLYNEENYDGKVALQLLLDVDVASSREPCSPDRRGGRIWRLARFARRVCNTKGLQ